jgi:putative tryptophan/tyrosine transport system substrate-binding protein
MKRRQFIKLVAGAAASWLLTALAQAHKPALIAWLTGVPLSSTTSTRMFLQGLQDLGYVEDRDFQVTLRLSFHGSTS